MKRNVWIAGALALAVLAGCSSAPKPVMAASDDIAYQVCDIRRDDAIVKVDGMPVAAEQYLFWLANSIAAARQYGELSTDDAWERIMGDSMTVSDALKADALESAKFYRIVETKAAENGVSITAEQEADMQSQLNEAIASVGGEEEFLAQLESMCISKEGFLALNRVAYLGQALQDKLTEDGTLTVTQEDIDKFVAENFPAGEVYAAKHILLSTRKLASDGSYEEMTEEERAAVQERAKAMRQQLRDAGDSEELFDELMNRFSDDGRDEEGKLYSPNGYGLVYTGQMVPEFEQAAMALQEGQISEPVATSYGYHIVMRIPLDQTEIDAAVKSGCTAEYKLQSLLDRWMDEAQVTTTAAYDALSPKDFSRRLTVITTARQAARVTPPPEATPGA